MDFSKVKENLEKNGFAVSVLENAAAAADYLDAAIDGKTVSFGGSVTLQQMGLFDRLSKHNQLIDHWHVPENASRQEVLTAAQTADVYLSSVNGLSENGEIVNIDGTGNRVSSIQFGHRKVYLVVGKNKLAKDLDGAIHRARNIAAPLNAKRLGCKTPCAVKGDKCYDCSSPERICRGVSVLLKKPGGAEYEVVLIDQELGF